MGYLVSHAYYVGGRMYRDMAHYGLVVTYREGITWNLLQEIDQPIRSFGDESPYVIADIFGKTAESCMHHFAPLQQEIYGRVVLRGRLGKRMLQGIQFAGTAQTSAQVPTRRL